MPTNTLLTAIKNHLKLNPTDKVIIEPITKGASGRTIIRLKPENHSSYIGIHYTLERADSANYLPVADFLKSNQFLVPEVLYNNTTRQCAIVQDLGEKDLLSMKGSPWEQRLPIYRSLFEQLDRLFYTRVPKDLEFQPEFDTEMYLWEQEYFFDFFAEYTVGMSSGETAPLRSHPALQQLAKQLGASSRNLVHRDLQSQNIMIKDNQAYLIDFQGMRRGRQEYDLASFIYDPYMNHSPQEREQLLDLWEDISEERPIDSILKQCATQRLMQALGAYGNLVTNKGQSWYAQHIPTAITLLKEVIEDTPYQEPITTVLNSFEG